MNKAEVPGIDFFLEKLKNWTFDFIPEKSKTPLVKFSPLQELSTDTTRILFNVY